MPKIIKKLKVQLPGGKATPAPPVGPTLGQAGINIGDFINKFNEATKDRTGDVIPVEISVYDDRSYTFILKTPSATSLLFRAAGIEKGSGKNTQQPAGTVTKAQVREIAEKKLTDLNAKDVDQAAKIIEGSARSAGIRVV